MCRKTTRKLCTRAKVYGIARICTPGESRGVFYHETDIPILSRPGVWPHSDPRLTPVCPLKPRIPRPESRLFYNPHVLNPFAALRLTDTNGAL